MAQRMSHTGNDKQQGPRGPGACDDAAQVQDAGGCADFGHRARHEDQGDGMCLVPGLILAQSEKSAVIGKRYVRKGLLGHGTKLA